jgi:hypothetical protein
MTADKEEFRQVLEDMQATAAAKEAAEMAAMFIQPSICLHCGVLVAIPEAHKRFHDGLDRFVANVNSAVETLTGRSKRRQASSAEKARPPE